MAAAIDRTKKILALDEIVREVNTRKIEPAFSDEVRRRLDRYQSAPTTDTVMLREMASLIAYSQSARSELVTAMLESGAFEHAFEGFKLDAGVRLNWAPYDRNGNILTEFGRVVPNQRHSMPSRKCGGRF